MNDMNIRLVGDHVLIEPQKPEASTTASGIFIPDSANKDGKPERGTVVAIGEGRVLESGDFAPYAFKTSDQVMYLKSYNAQEIKSNGKEYVIVRGDDIIAVVNN